MAKPRGLKRLVKAAMYSWHGLLYTTKHEEAFRLELGFAAIMLPLSWVFDVSSVERILMVASVILVLIVELLNSAIEAVVDRIGPESHELSGAAKDIGSAAVFLALGLCLFVWGSCVLA